MLYIEHPYCMANQSIIMWSRSFSIQNERISIMSAEDWSTLIWVKRYFLRQHQPYIPSVTLAMGFNLKVIITHVITSHQGRQIIACFVTYDELFCARLHGYFKSYLFKACEVGLDISISPQLENRYTTIHLLLWSYAMEWLMVSEIPSGRLIT